MFIFRRISSPRSKRGRNFEGLYIQSTEKCLNDDMHMLYQGGTPINFSDDNDKYKALPLSIAKINFNSEIKPAKYKNDCFSSHYTPLSHYKEYENQKNQ